MWVRDCVVAATSPSRRNGSSGCQIFMAVTIAIIAAIDARMTARAGPMVLVTANSTTAKVTAHASTCGSTSRARRNPDMTTTM